MKEIYNRQKITYHWEWLDKRFWWNGHSYFTRKEAIEKMPPHISKKEKRLIKVVETKRAFLVK